MNPELKERLLKLLRLAKGGVGGEQKNAEAMLEKLLAQHGMKMADIDDTMLEKRRVMFRLKSKLERRLLCQILATVTDDDFRFYTLKGDRSLDVYSELTPSHEAEAVVMFSVLRKSFQEEMDVFFSAFIHANRLFPKTKKPDPDDEKPLTPEQRARAMRAAQMAAGINKAKIHKQIGGGK